MNQNSFQNINSGGFQNQYPPGPSYGGGQGYNNNPNGVIIVDPNVQQNILPRDASFSRVSTKVTCPKCNTPAMTRVNHECGAGAVIWSIVLAPCLIGLFCCCMPTCKDKHHFCAKCGAPVGVKKVYCTE